MSTKASTTRKATASPKPANAGRLALATFTPKGTDGEQHKCAGVCGLRLPVRKFPTSKVAGVRVAECRSCRDMRTRAAALPQPAK